MPRHLARSLGLVLLAASASLVGAQSRAIVVSGSVADDAGRPIESAIVEQADGAARTRTGVDGRFALPITLDDSSRTVRLAVRRQGFRATSVEVRIDGPGAPAPVAIRLSPLAAALDRVLVEGPADRPMSTAMTRQGLERAPPFVEPDAFRQLTLLPSILQTNGFVARPHIAGAALDEALYTIDGHPLQSPTHVRGMGAGINFAALDRVEVLSHHLPATMDGRIGGVIAMHSRRVGEQGDGEALVSSLSVTAAHAEPSLAGTEVVVAGRTTYLDGRLAGMSKDWLDETYPLNDFRDGLIRVSRDVAGWRGDLLGFLSTDLHLAETEPSDPFRGEYLVGVTLARGDSSRRTTLRASRDLATRAMGQEPGIYGGFMRSRQVLATASLEQERRLDGRTRGALRVAITNRRNAQRWTNPLSEVEWEIRPRDALPYRFDGTTSLTLVSAGARVERALGDAFVAELGLAVDGTRAGVVAAPRARLGWRATPDLAIDLSIERRHQFDGEYTPEIIVDLASPTFLFDRPRRLDAVAVSAAWRRRWDRWSLALNGDLYARRISDRPIGSGPFSLAVAHTLDFRRVNGRAIGAGLATVLSGPRDASLAMTLGLSRTMDRDWTGWARSTWDRPHSIMIVGTTPRALGISLSATYRNVSGLPATPITGIVPAAGTQLVFPISRPLFGRRNSAALPATNRFDLALRREWRMGRLRGDLQAQVINVTGERIPMSMTWSSSGSGLSPEVDFSEVERFNSFGLSLRW